MLADTPLLPWHSAQWKNLTRAYKNQQLPHALLLHGAKGIGKRRFMQRLAQALVCTSPSTEHDHLSPCGQCQSCKQHADGGSHADILRIRMEEGDREIKIEKARAVISFSTLSSHYGGRKLVLIETAERLNKSAANALLKTLEEPPPSTMIILSAEQPSKLIATIRSRCQQIRFGLPDTKTAVAWLIEQGIESAELQLSEAGGAPLKAVEMAGENISAWRQDRDKELKHFILDKRSASRLAQHWLQFNQTDLHAWLYDRCKRIQWFYNGFETSIDALPHIKTMLEQKEFTGLDHAQQQLNDFSLTEVNNINKQLCLESILVSFSKIQRDPQTTRT